MDAKLFFENTKRPDFLVEGLIYRGELVLFAGFWGSAKSWLAEHLGVCVDLGKPFLGRTTAKGVVMLIDEETKPEALSIRLQRLARGLGDEPSNMSLIIHSQIRLQLHDTKMMKAIAAEIKEKNVSLVIIDSLVDVLGALSENEMEGVLSQLKLLKGDSTMVIIHHFGKKGGKFGTGDVTFTDAVRGSSKLLGAVDSAFSVRGQSWPRVVRVEKHRYLEKLNEFAVNLPQGADDPIAALVEVPVPDEPFTPVEELLLPLFSEDGSLLTVNDAKSKLEGAASEHEIRQGFRSLESRGIVNRGKAPHNRYTYNLAERAAQAQIEALEPSKTTTHYFLQNL